jgi:anti-anti-sigma factor
VIIVDGPVVEAELQTLSDGVDQCISTGNLKIIFDISQVPFIDSRGLDQFLAFNLNIGKQGGEVRITNPNDVCKDIFKATGLENIIQVFDTREGGVKSLL